MTFDNTDYYSLEDFDRQCDAEDDYLTPADNTHSLDYLAKLDGLPLSPGELAEIEREGREQIDWEAYENNEDTEETIDLDQYLFYTVGFVPF